MRLSCISSGFRLIGTFAIVLAFVGCGDPTVNPADGWSVPDWSDNGPDGTGDNGQRDVLEDGHDYGDSPNWPDAGTTPVLSSFALRKSQNCGELTELWRQQAVAIMEQRMNYGWYAVTRTHECRPEPDYGYGADTVVMCDVSAPGDSGSSANEYTTTNNQEVDVDEADFLKNDGTYIYMLANGKFRVLKAWPPTEATVLSTTAIEGDPRSMFVYEGRAVIFSSLGSGYEYYDSCTYGYDCELTGDGRPLKVTVLDLTDLENPAVVRESEFSGTFLAARRVNDFIYMVVYSDPPAIPQDYRNVPIELQQYTHRCDGDPLPFTREEVEAMFRELHATNIAYINAWVADTDTILPGLTDRVLDGGDWKNLKSPFGDCSQYYLSAAGDGGSLLSLVSFDMNADKGMTASSILTRPGTIYSSSQSLYVAARYQGIAVDEWSGGQDIQEATTLHRFSLSADGPATTYEASGLAAGRILNQFSLSEYKGYLRVATTSGSLFSDASSALRVFSQEGDRLVEVGTVGDMGPSEDIRSVRFSGDKGYIVTFKKTDPLYVLDLSDPTDPKITGELKIPGFSTYMHFMDETHLLTIGYDADDQGSFAYFDGIALSVFDVTDPANPALMHREVIGTRGTTSEAATNHLAFTWFASRNALALPMQVCEGGGDGNFGQTMTFNGLMVYRVTQEEGFTYLGGIPHPVPAEDEYNGYYGSGCSNWWTDSHSTVLRSIFMDDWVFSIAMDEIRASALSDLAHPVAILPLTP
jgi:hypothetical protein